MMQNIGEVWAAIIACALLTFLVWIFSPVTAIFLIIHGLIFGSICSGMARVRWRAAGMGVLGGYLFGLFSVFYYMIAGDTTELRVKREEDARARYRKELKDE